MNGVHMNVHMNHFMLLQTLLHREFLVIQSELLYIRMFKILLFLIGCYRLPLQSNFDVASILRLMLLICAESTIVYCFLFVNVVIALTLSAVVWSVASQAFMYYTRIFNWTFLHLYVRCFYLIQSMLISIN